MVKYLFTISRLNVACIIIDSPTILSVIDESDCGKQGKTCISKATNIIRRIELEL